VHGSEGLKALLEEQPDIRIVAEFADAVARGGALPMVAFALLNGSALDTLLAKTAELLGDKPWGIGLLGFAPQALLDEQLGIATRYKPNYAIIAGGRPDQVDATLPAGTGLRRASRRQPSRLRRSPRPVLHTRARRRRCPTSHCSSGAAAARCKPRPVASPRLPRR
jgi:hypothetical protein